MGDDKVMVQFPPEYTLSIDLSNGEDNTVYVMTKDQTVIECGVYDGNMRTIVEQLISETIQIHKDSRRWIGHTAGMRACANTRLRTVKTSGLRGGS